MDETQLGAGSSEVSLHSNTAAGAAAAACSSSKGKGGHISALRSLGLLHELQVVHSPDCYSCMHLSLSLSLSTGTGQHDKICTDAQQSLRHCVLKGVPVGCLTAGVCCCMRGDHTAAGAGALEAKGREEGSRAGGWHTFGTRACDRHQAALDGLRIHILGL